MDGAGIEARAAWFLIGGVAAAIIGLLVLRGDGPLLLGWGAAALGAMAANAGMIGFVLSGRRD
jgi:hypothetical protein